jgi:hypothetical protein
MLVALGSQVAGAQPRFEVTIPESLGGPAPVDGRVLVILAPATEEREPREMVREDVKSAQVFGVDAEGLRPGGSVVVDSSALGFPFARMLDVPTGEYSVQAVLHRYETFKRADGHTVKLPMDRGEGQHWNRAPGNLYSSPVKVHFEPNPVDPRDVRDGGKDLARAMNAPIRITLDQVIPPIEPPKDTKFVKHITIQSKLLSDFWGRPMRLSAAVLLPKRFDEHPEARYPLMVNHGHFDPGFDEFREEPPDPNLKPEYSERFRMEGYNIVQQQLAHEFYQDWMSESFPRFVVVKIQHPNPFYDDSYAVNSANLGPYGDAIMKELLPAVEKQFRCIGQGWARFTYGGSTGGWEALAVQLFYPDEFNGCFAACPDPIDFRSYGSVNIYEDKNAYFATGPFAQAAWGTGMPRPATRDHWGVMTASLEGTNRLELVLGEHSRSGSQWDIWEAVFGPVGPDGYPARIWDKRTGEIDPSVAAYWRDHFDLCHILQRDWKTLGPKLKGKIHIYCGTMDNYYLNNAVTRMEEFLRSTKDPVSDALVDYECGSEHCWNGDHTRPNGLSRLRYNQMYIPLIMKQIEQTAPAGADVTSWRYK